MKGIVEVRAAGEILFKANIWELLYARWILRGLTSFSDFPLDKCRVYFDDNEIPKPKAFEDDK